MLKISASCFKSAFFLSPSVLSGLVEVGLRRACIRSADECNTTYFDDILGKRRLIWKNSLVLETSYFSVLGKDARQRQCSIVGQTHYN